MYIIWCFYDELFETSDLITWKLTEMRAADPPSFKLAHGTSKSSTWLMVPVIPGLCRYLLLFLAATGSVEVLVACQVWKCLLHVHVNLSSHEPPNSGGIPTQLRLQCNAWSHALTEALCFIGTWRILESYMSFAGMHSKSNEGQGLFGVSSEWYFQTWRNTADEALPK